MNAAEIHTSPCGSAVAVLRPCPRRDGPPTCACTAPLTATTAPPEVLVSLGWTCRQQREGFVLERSARPPAAVSIHHGSAGPELWLDAGEVLSIAFAEELAVALLEAAALARSASA